MEIPSLLRLAEHKALSQISLSGSVLDLGGDTRSKYRTCFKGDPVFTTVNLDPKANPDILHDLEQPLPLPDSSHDHVVLINVLEHVFNYQQLLAEAQRVVRPGGSVIVVVPYLFPYHPSPSDYWRFSEPALKRMCVAVGLTVHTVAPLGTGVFATRYVMLDRLLPKLIRMVAFNTLRYVTYTLDALFEKVSLLTGRAYRKESYALGFAFYATKEF